MENPHRVDLSKNLRTELLGENHKSLLACIPEVERLQRYMGYKDFCLVDYKLRCDVNDFNCVIRASSNTSLFPSPIGNMHFSSAYSPVRAVYHAIALPGEFRSVQKGLIDADVINSKQVIRRFRSTDGSASPGDYEHLDLLVHDKALFLTLCVFSPKVKSLD